MTDEAKEIRESAPHGASEVSHEAEAEGRPSTPAEDGAKPASGEARADARGAFGAWAERNVDPLVGAGLGTAYVAWLLGTARSLGFSRDEGFYFSAATEYERWFKLLLKAPRKAFERGAIDGIWQNNHEHPSLMKSLFALSHMFLYEKWKIFSDASTAFRFPGMLMMALAIFVTYMFAARAFSRRAGVVAAVALGLMPRLFYHAHLACFDVPIMAMWTTCVYVYWRAEGGGFRSEETGRAQVRRTGGLGWATATGVVYGLTLETKHNAWMLPAVFVVHALLVHGHAMSRSASRTGRLPIPASLVMMALLGPPIFVGLWPWLWNDTGARIQEYVNFHVHHDYYNIEFLGQTYFGPPSPKAYMPVMILATVPTATLLLFAVGAFDRLRLLAARLSRAASVTLGRALAWPSSEPGEDRAGTDILIFLALAVPLGPFILPRTPIFGGTKHWIPAYPFLAMLAGWGFELVWQRIAAWLSSRSIDAHKQRIAQYVLGALTFGGALATTIHSHPFGLSSYVPFFGGTAGGADLGLNRQFWGFTTESLAPYFEKNAKPGDTVYFMDTAWPSWQRMIEEKRIPSWLRGVGSPAEAEFSIVHHEQHMNEVDYNIWTEYRSSTPDYVLTHDGVPIISVYRRSHTRAPR